MTDSTDNARGPERIIILCDEANYLCAAKFPASPDENDLVTYVRDDIAPDPLADPRVKALVDALRKISALDDIAECCGQGVCGGYSPPECCGQPIYGLDRAHNIARAALAALSHTGGNDE